MATSQEILDAIEAALLGTLDRNAAAYTIDVGGSMRSLSSLSIKELLDARDRIRREVDQRGLPWVHGVAVPMRETEP